MALGYYLEPMLLWAALPLGHVALRVLRVCRVYDNKRELSRVF